jgi:large subunit ribosomal protein L17
MKKRIRKHKLNVKASHSKLMLKNLLESLLTYGKIETTEKKAKVLKSYADEKLSYVFRSKSKKVDNQIMSALGSARLSEKAFKFVNFLKKQGKENMSGFTSMVRTRYRKGDNSLMIEVSLIGFDDFVKASKPVKKKIKKTKVVKKPSIKQKKTTKVKDKDSIPSQPSQREASASLKDVQTEKKVDKKPEIKKIEKKRDEGFLSKLSERFLGRKTKGPDIGRQSRARSRSGL